MARIIAITNNKGGCGKTTTAVNMGAALRLRGFDVLLIDYDGQANLTATLGVEALSGSTVYDAVKRPDTPYIQPARVLYPTASGCGVLDVLPACEDLAAVDVEHRPGWGRVLPCGSAAVQRGRQVSGMYGRGNGGLRLGLFRVPGLCRCASAGAGGTAGNPADRKY